jgi:uncharacterized FAD-dependent dehydrogenase
MQLRVSNVRVAIDEPEIALAHRLHRMLKVDERTPLAWRILRKSLDVRDKARAAFVYTVHIDLSAELAQKALREPPPHCRLEAYAAPPFAMPAAGSQPLRHRPIIVGSGPAGLVAGYFLAREGYSPLVLERGRPVHERIRDVKAFDAGGTLDPESNYLFGEGGAGTFSDGKLTCRGAGPDVQRVLELFADSKGKPSVVYEQRPHLGSNRLPALVKSLRRQIEARGGEVRFGCRVEDLRISDGMVQGLNTSSGFLTADAVVLAIGHSARDTYRMLLERGVPMVPKPFQLGVRIEQPQETVNRVQYGTRHLEEKLGAADYTLIARQRFTLFTFCMCAGGEVIPSVSAPGYFSTNGMSLSRRASPFANSGLMITLEPEHFPGTDALAGVRLQEIYERKAYEIGRGEYACPIQTANDFLNDRLSTALPVSSYPRQLVSARIADIVPPEIVEALKEGLPALDRRWHGRFLNEATLTGPEARGSSPVRIVRDNHSREAPGIAGLFPVGEGAGYAGGIISAAVDGLLTAKAIAGKYAPLIEKCR